MNSLHSDKNKSEEILKEHTAPVTWRPSFIKKLKLERTKKDHLSPNPGPAQDTARIPPLPESTVHFLNSLRLGTVTISLGSLSWCPTTLWVVTKMWTRFGTNYNFQNTHSSTV